MLQPQNSTFYNRNDREDSSWFTLIFHNYGYMFLISFNKSRQRRLTHIGQEELRGIQLECQQRMGMLKS